jgi:para-nitrobenzyl esterase
VFGNHTDADLARWPTFESIDRDELTRVSGAAMDLYGAVIRGDDPGPRWPRFTPDERGVLRIGNTLEPRPGLLDDDIAILAENGLRTVTDIENRLTGNMRTRLTPPGS